MVEKDVMVIVPIGEYEGIKMWRSEAIKQGLRYKVIGKEYAAEIEDKMVKPKENKVSKAPVFEPVPPEDIIPVTPPGVQPPPKPVPPKTESAPKTTKRKTTKK